MSDASEKRGGYKTPPASIRFRKGQSGNPLGRPRGRRNELPYDAVLGQQVTIREDGVERRVSAAEAFLLQVTKQGLGGDGAAARPAMAAIEAAREMRTGRGADDLTIVRVIVNPGSVTETLELLRMGRKLDRYRETARMAIEPWLVEAALQRLGPRQLSRDEQSVVLRATRLPQKVQWPPWWEVLPAARSKLTEG